MKYDSGKEQKKKIYIVDPVEKCCQFTRVAFFFSYGGAAVSGICKMQTACKQQPQFEAAQPGGGRPDVHHGNRRFLTGT